MNKFKLLLVALVFGSVTLFANTVNPDVSGDEIRSQIIELVDASTATLETQISVNIVFSFNTEGEIVVLKVDSREKELIDFVRNNINGKKIENPGKMRRKYEMFITVK